MFHVSVTYTLFIIGKPSNGGVKWLSVIHKPRQDRVLPVCRHRENGGVRLRLSRRKAIWGLFLQAESALIRRCAFLERWLTNNNTIWYNTENEIRNTIFTAYFTFIQLSGGNVECFALKSILSRPLRCQFGRKSKVLSDLSTRKGSFFELSSEKRQIKHDYFH